MSAATVIVIHGYLGHPDGGFKPWLVRELAKNDIDTVIAPMPPTIEAKQHEWLAVINHTVKRVKPPIIIVGHSLGGLAVLRYLEKPPAQPILATILVATVTNKDSHPLFYDFFKKPIDWLTIGQNAGKIYAINSSNDTHVGVKEGQLLEKELGAKLIVLKNRHHFSTADGTTDLPELVTMIRALVQS